jgi:Tannase and feruloyl esterase
VIGTEIRFSLLLPDTWNGNFMMGGGGAFVGSLDNQASATVNAGYATVGTDTGHQGDFFEARWALNNLERQVNFGYIAVHRTAETAEAIVRQITPEKREHTDDSITKAFAVQSNLYLRNSPIRIDARGSPERNGSARVARTRRRNRFSSRGINPPAEPPRWPRLSNSTVRFRWRARACPASSIGSTSPFDCSL